MVGLLGFAALAIDISYLHLVTGQAQNVADAGAHAGVIALRKTSSETTARTAAIEVVNANRLAGETAEASDSDVVFGGWDWDSRVFTPGSVYTNAVRVDVRKAADSPNGRVQLSLAKIFGELQSGSSDAGEVETAGRAVGAMRGRDIMVLLDITLSFAEEFDQVRDAMLAFLDGLDAAGFPNDRVGLVVFTAEAALYSPLRWVSTSHSTIRGEWQQLDLCTGTAMPADCFASPTSRGAGTDHARALALAWGELTDNRADNVNAVQMMVMITDGMPYCMENCDPTACHGAIKFDAQGQAAQAMNVDRISTYTIGFMDPSGTSSDGGSCPSYGTSYSEQSIFMESLVHGYGEHFDLSDAGLLVGSMESVARSVPVALVQ
jgi:hypothetical protein